MKFVIWGAGMRGKRIADFIGYYNVKAFIDSNSSLRGMKYNGIAIIGIDEYIDSFRDCFLIVTPLKNKEIIDELTNRGIDTYFLLEECPSEIIREEIYGMDEIQLPPIEWNRAVIYGASLYSVLLWEKLFKQGIDIPIVIENEKMDRKILSNMMSSKVYPKKKYLVRSDDIVLQTVRIIPKLSGVQVVDFYHIANYLARFRHPDLEKFKNKHKDERCFIVGNGSSLTTNDLNRLAEKKEVCMGMNGIPIIFNDTIWRPDYYVCEDPKGMEEFGDMILECKMLTIFISDLNKNFLEKTEQNKNVFSFHMNRGDYMPNMPFFSEDIVRSIYNGFTVTYVCIQIAVYMGFREIFLLGVDFDYSDGDTVEMRHFSENYHRMGSGVKPNACRKTENLLAYQAAKEYSDVHNIKIFNATRGGKLEVFDRVDFDDLF